jgi:hypothetical protein
MIKRLNEFSETEDRSSILFDKFYKKVELFRDLLIDLEHDRKVEKYYFYYSIDGKYRLYSLSNLWELKTTFTPNEENLEQKIIFFIKLILKSESNVKASKNVYKTDDNFKLEGKLSIEVIYEKRHQDITDDLLELAEVSNALKVNGHNSELSLGNDAKIRLRITDDKFL